jgi:UPF0755 protein
VGAIVLVALFFLLRGCFRSTDPDEQVYIFTVSKTADAASIKEKLWQQEYMEGRPLFGLDLFLHGGYHAIEPGGFKIKASMSSWELAGLLTSQPQLTWVTIPEGLRREQVADRVGKALEWDDAQKMEFLNANVITPYELTEGFYFPDTYLIPRDEEPVQVVKRFIARFNENFDPLLPALREQNIRYNTAVKLASIIQREAGGQGDMPLIAGILWNRLLQGIKLEVDATLQYARGDEGDGYWASPDPSLKNMDSPFNTYKNKGLPPQPISNPGLDAIKAVISPEETTCLFYLHSADRQIHCAVTYEEHLHNIDVYLRTGD